MTILPAIHRMLSWRLFARQDDLVTKIDIIKWWELRRIPFNLLVGATGLFTCAVTLAISAIASEKFNEPLGLPDPPIIAVFAVLAYGIAANLCYTGGWIVELFVTKVWKERAGAFGQITFFLGSVFSVLLTLLPAALFTCLLVLRLLLSPSPPTIDQPTAARLSTIADQWCAKYLADNRRDVPEAAWTPEVRAFRPIRVSVSEDGIHIDLGTRFVESWGVFVLRSGAAFKPDLSGDPSYKLLRDRVYWFEFKG